MLGAQPRKINYVCCHTECRLTAAHLGAGAAVVLRKNLLREISRGQRIAHLDSPRPKKAHQMPGTSRKFRVYGRVTVVAPYPLHSLAAPHRNSRRERSVTHL